MDYFELRVTLANLLFGVGQQIRSGTACFVVVQNKELLFHRSILFYVVDAGFAEGRMADSRKGRSYSLEGVRRGPISYPVLHLTGLGMGGKP
jgi:hypothetical protein